MDEKAKGLTQYRLQRAKEDLDDAKLLYTNNRFLSANNRAYYSIFHAIKAVLSIERVDFKKHKDVTAYFNKNYVNTNIFPKKMGRKIGQAFRVREDSDYEDEYEVNPETTRLQIETAEELIELVEKYIEDKI